jgi:nucleotide-binding universal stress UspA family protein
MKTILFPTDFSKNAYHASLYAGMLAKLCNSNLVFLHVHHIPMFPESNDPTDISNTISINEKIAHEQLEALAKKFSEDLDFPTDRISQRVEYGFVNTKIVETASSINADAIVMGTKGATDLLDKWMGTNAQEVMNEADCPVFTIPKNVPFDTPKSILYAADFKEDETAATQKLLDIAKPLGAECKVIHIHEPFEPNIGHIFDETIKELETKFSNENVTFKDLHRDDIIEGLETYIKTHSPDLLALAIHEKSFFSKIFGTSITQHFIQEAKLPILTFRK